MPERTKNLPFRAALKEAPFPGALGAAFLKWVEEGELVAGQYHEFIYGLIQNDLLYAVQSIPEFLRGHLEKICRFLADEAPPRAFFLRGARQDWSRDRGHPDFARRPS